MVDDHATVCYRAQVIDIHYSNIAQQLNNTESESDINVVKRERKIRTATSRSEL